MKFSLNKKSLIIALSLIALCVVVYSLTQQVQTTPAPEAPPINGIQSDAPMQIQSFTFAGSRIVPTTLDVYTSNEAIRLGEDLASTIATTLNLTPSDIAGIWTNTEAGDTLSYSQVDKNIQYTNDITATPNVFTQDTADRSVAAATAFLQKVGFGERVSANIPNIRYYFSVGEFIPAELSTSNIAEIPYSFTIDRYPVFFESSTLPLAVVVVDAAQQVLKAEFYNIPPAMTKHSTSETYTLDEAMENIKNGKGALVSTQLINATHSISDIASADFSQVRIEYRFTESSSLYYPYYRFIGTGRTAQGGTLGIEIITPAVR